MRCAGHSFASIAGWVILAGVAAAQSNFDGLSANNSLGVGHNWSVDFAPFSQQDQWQHHGLGNGIYPSTDPNNPFTFTVSRAQGSGYFALPFSTSATVALAVAGTGLISPGNIQTLAISEYITNANTNLYGFGVGGSGTFNWNFSGADPTVYWAVDWSNSVTASNGLGTANFSLSINGVTMFNQSESATATFTGGAFGSAPLGTPLIVTFNSVISANQTDLALAQTIRFAFSTSPITAVPEPSAYAILAGVGALGLAAWRRRRAA